MALAGIAAQAPVEAADKYWLPAAGCDGASWDNGACWNPFGQPTGGDAVFLTQTSAVDSFVNYVNTAYPAAVLTALTIDSTAGGLMTLSQTTGDTLHSVNEYVGNSGRGTHVQSSGTNLIDSQLMVGRNAGSVGNYQFSGGTISAGYVEVGVYAGSTGTFAQSGGLLEVGIEEYVGYFGTGTFNQSGGTHTMAANTNVFIGHVDGAVGTFNLSGGSYSSDLVYVGNAGQGTFIQTGGTHTVGRDLILGNKATGIGTYTLSDGNLIVAGAILKGAGSSTLNLDGGTLLVGGGNGSITVGSLVLGSTAGSSGNHTLSGIGSIAATNLMYVGAA